jgi:hypothetical protein
LLPAPPQRALCFVAMPSDQQAAAAGGAAIDFAAVYQAVAAGIDKAGVESRRADFAPRGGFVERARFESLLVAEFVVVDLSLANPNVAYAVGLRHGAHACTLLICEEACLQALPFDCRPPRTIPYRLTDLAALSDGVAKRLTEAMAGRLAPDHPILELAHFHAGASGHEKTDRFAQHMTSASEIGAAVSNILVRPDGAGGIAQLQALETRVLDAAQAIAQPHTALLAIYLGYRAKKAWPEMVALFGRMPGELAASPVAREQLALAHNRIAEKLKDPAAAHAERQKALLALDAIPKEKWTSETFGILGRIQKGRADAELAAQHEAESRAALAAAIEAYESGFRADPRDYYPGVNAVTLRILRDSPDDRAALRFLLPAVRFSVARAPTPAQKDEVYWQAATRLELATAARDWDAAQGALADVRAVQVDEWMRESTAANLARQARARADEPATQTALQGYIAALLGGARSR